MIWISIVYISIATLIILGGIFAIIINQLKISSNAVYYYLAMHVSLILWFLSNLFLVIYSHYNNKNLALIFSRSATVWSMIAMILVVLFARFLTSKRLLDSKSVVISFFIFGGVIALTLSSAYGVTEVAVGKTGEIFYLAKADFIWILFDGALPLYAGTILITYLLRQKLIVTKKRARPLNLMIIGASIAFYLSALIFILRTLIFYFTSSLQLLHIELMSIAIGASIMTVATIQGGVKAFYYSSKIYSLYIYDDTGFGIYTATFESAKIGDETFIPGVAAAISAFAADLIGKNVQPKEIDFGNYSLIIEKLGKYNCFICSAYPTANLRGAVKNLLKHINGKMRIEEISELVEAYLAIKPKVKQ
ncbi:MAG: hypothetical protein ACTSQE_06600 [Candidatus Heimdallarchaeaceae archaeon]